MAPDDENNKENEAEEEALKEESKELEKETIDPSQKLIGAEITNEMKRAYIDYAMSVIVSRALPAVEDGLKPVHRRILYAMHELNLYPNKQTVKSARIVGNVLGNFHPHGDIAVYDSLVRMAQDFSLRYPLIHGQGNFGCFTKDTKVALTDGRAISFSELIDEYKSGRKNYTYTINKNEDIEIAEIKNPRLTKQNQKILKIILDNNEEIKCTYDHRFMLRDGSYKQAKDLKAGDSLMPLYVRLSTSKDTFKPALENYQLIYQPRTNKWIPCHNLADMWNLKNGIYAKNSGRIRHHVNFNKLNNNPNNITRMPWKDHWQIHYNLTSIKHKNSQEYRDALAEGRRKFGGNESNRQIHSERMTQRNLKNWKNKNYREKMRITLSEINKNYLKNHPEIIERISKTASMTFKRLWQIPKYRELFHNKIVASNKRRETNLTGKKKFLKICSYLKEYQLPLNKENFERIRKEIFGIKSFTSWDLGIRKYFNNDQNFLLCEVNSNHKVKSIELKKEFSDVYDLTIENTHNFALASGVFVHNSIDGDPAAAMRYSEAKLASISEKLLEDLDKDTVNFIPNFDNSTKEPEVLPAKLPNLLINGSSGIAVGMATNIPSHNLTEVCEAIAEYINKPEISIEKLAEIIKGPDFPTGGQISGDILEMYKTGKGKLIVRGKTNIETEKGKESIIITEIPYMVNKSDLVKEIARLVSEKKLPDITDIRDESAKGKIRIVIELKRSADSKFTINRLYQYTRLQDRFDVNMLALIKGKPHVLNLKQIIETYVNHRKDVVTRRSKFELKKAEERLEIVEGLLKAIKIIDDIISLIKKSETAAEANENLQKKFDFTKRQAQAILETRLQQLTSLEHSKLKKEQDELKEKIQELKKILSSVQEILSVVKKEVNEIKRQFGDERRSQILQRIAEISEKDLVQKKEVVINITEKGYVKRIDLKTYKEQKRGGKGVIGSDLSTGDFVKQFLTCSTHDYLLFFTSKGRIYWLKAYQIPEGERYGKGRAIINLLNLKDEIIASVIAVKKFEGFLIFVTKQGIVKKLLLSDLAKPRSTGVRIMNLPIDGSDVLIDVKPITEKQEMLLVTKDGQAIRFNSDEIRAMGRSSYGVTGIKLEKGDEVVSLEVLPLEKSKSTILTITEKGYGKRSAIDDYRLTGRAGKGIINLRVSDKTGPVVTTVSVEEKDSIIVTTQKGMVIRTSVKALRIMGRATQGVRIVKMQEGDKVSDLVKVQELEENLA